MWTPPPPPRIGSVDVVDGAEVYTQGPLRVLRTERGWRILHGATAAAVLDDAGAVLDAVVASEDGRRVYEDVVAVVACAIRARLEGRFHVHAGLVVDARGRGTLICGQSGTGKTTTTLALLAAGYALAGDDVAFLHVDSGACIATALPRPLHVGDATLQMFPALRARLRPGVRTLAGKHVVDVSPGTTDAVRVQRVVLPSITTTPTAARALGASAAFPRLLRAGAMVAWPHLAHSDEHLEVLRRLVDLPILAVDLGPDALIDPGVLVPHLRGR